MVLILSILINFINTDKKESSPFKNYQWTRMTQMQINLSGRVKESSKIKLSISAKIIHSNII